jgi:TP901 family phage tail tape measure protein
MPSEQVGSAYATVGFKVDESGLNSAKSKFSSAIGEIEGKARSAGSAIGSALTTGVTAATVALAGVATVGVKTYMDIESAAADAASKMDLSAIAQKSGTTTAAAFDAVKEHVMSLADELGQLNTNAFDPTQIAQACANLAAQGFDVATASAKDLAPVLTLAIAANYDLGDSANMAMSTMNTFGMKVEDLGHIADVYTTACGASAAGMGDLNYAMQQAGPVASVANISFETLTACLETFSQSNIKGEKAGTALRGAINTLITPTKALTDGLGAIGLTMDQVDPRSNDFVDVLKKMKTQADASGLGLSAFTQIFGAEGGLLYKLASSTDQIEEFRQGLLNCDGAAEQMAKNMLDNLKGSMDAAYGAASSLAYLIGGKLAPSLKAAFDWFSASGAPAIRTFIEALSAGNFEAAGNQIGITVERIKSAVAGLATGVGVTVFAAGLASLIPVAASMAAGVIASTASMVAATGASIAAMAASHVSGFASMVATSVSSWATMKALAISSWASQKAAALASMALTVEVTLSGYAKMATGALASMLSMAAGVAASFGSMAMNAALRLGTMTAATLSGYAKMATGALASVASMVAGTLAGFASMVTGVVASVAGMAASLAAPLLLIGAGLAAIGLATDPSKFTTLGKIGSDALNGLKSVASDCWEAIEKGDFGAVASRLKTAFSSSVDYIKNINWSGVGSDIVKAIGVGWDALKGYAATAGAAAMDALKAALAFGSDIAKGLYEDFENIDWSGVWDSLVSAWDSTISTLSDVGKTILGYFDGVDWGTVGFKLGKAIRDAIEKLADIGSTVWNYLTSADWSGAGSSITEKIKGGLETLSDAWDSFKAGLLAVDWGAAATDVADKLKAGWKQVTDWAGSIIDGVKKDFNDWISGGGPKTLGEDLAKAVAEGAKALGEWIYDKVEAFWKGISGDGGSLGTTIYTAFKNIFTTLIDWAKMALTAAYDFAVGFASTIITAGKGTIGAAILEIIGNAMNTAWDGAGDSLIERATQWRKDAEDIFSAEDFDVDVATTYTGAGNPKDLDGSTIAVNVQYTSTSGKNLSLSQSPEGGASVSATGGKLSVHLANAPSGGSSWMEATEWAKEMGKAGNTTEGFLKIIDGMKTAGTKLLPATIEKLTAAFVEGQNEYNATQAKANSNAIATEREVAEIRKTSVRDILSEAKSTSSEHIKSLMDYVTGKGTATSDAISAAGAAAAEKILMGSQTAANAIQAGIQVASGFLTSGSQAVKIGLDSAGREIAVIGSVAQQKFTAAGGDLYSKVIVAGSDLQSKISGAGSSLQSSSALAGLSLVSGGTSISASCSNGASAINNASTNLNSAASAVGAAAAKVLGGTLSWGKSSTVSSTTTASTASAGPWGPNSGLSGWGGKPKGAATGTKTSGPELAVIGEDGPSNPEFVIPTKNKRWDLLYAAMRAYGIPGYAEGTATGAASGEAGKSENMTATFGITGLAEMASSVKKIINNLKDFFRITWDIIKGEGAKYWKSITKVITEEATAMRDGAWAELIDVRNTAISANASILANAKTTWSSYLAVIKPSLGDVKEGITSSFSSAASAAKGSLDTMITNSTASLQSFRTKWQEIWTGLVTDLTAAQAKISAGVTAITTELKKISVNVSVNANINSSTAGTAASAASSVASASASLTDCLFEGFTDACTGITVNALKYTSPSGKVSYINPLTGMVVSTVGFSPTTNGAPYQLPAGLRAKGALVDKGPELDIVGEAGPELILPANITKMFVQLANMGFNAISGSGGNKIVIEDHTVNEHYWNGRKVADLVMTTSKKKLQLRGAIPTR